MRTTLRRLTLALGAFWLVAGLAAAASASGFPGDHPGKGKGRLLAAGLQGAAGSTVGPDGWLYVVEGITGEVTKIDPRNGKRKTFATGLPANIIGLPVGGPIDIAFIGDTAYVLVTLIGQFDPTGEWHDGIYRVDGKSDFELIADIGAFSSSHLPGFPVDLVNGLQFALEPVDQGFLVSDGHHNRILHVTLDGDISVLTQMANTVPTGMTGTFGTAYVAKLGPLPNLPEDGRVEAVPLLDPDNARTAASGVPMIIDVELAPNGRLFALSQGVNADPGNPVAPAQANTGRLLLVQSDGSFHTLVRGLHLPTSLSFSCHSAFVVTLAGEVRQFRTGFMPGYLPKWRCPATTW